MNQITAQLNDYRQSPRKVRVVATSIKGKSVKEAKNQLQFVTKRASGPLEKLLNSAVANAKDLGVEAENLFVKSITVNAGKILYRRRPVSHGSAHTIHKRTSHVKIILGEKAPVKKETAKKVTKSK